MTILFRLLFLQILYNLSDERVVQEAQVNLAYKWFLGLNPETPVPDSSQLSRFRNHRLGASQVENVLLMSVRQCVEHGLIKSNAVIVDATHTQANCQKQKPLEVLRDASKRLFRAVTKRYPKWEKQLPHQPKLPSDFREAEITMLHYLAGLGKTVEALLPNPEGAIADKLRIAKQIVEDERLLALKGIRSAIDPEARFGWKSNRISFFGYKEHLAMSEEEIILAMEVTGGNEDDGKQLLSLLDQVEKSGTEIQEVIADTRYSRKDNLVELANQNIQAMIPLNPIVHTGGVKQEGFQYNKDADAVMCPAGESSVSKGIQGSKHSSKNRSVIFRFDIQKCNQCSMRDGCLKPGAKHKTFSMRILADHHQTQLALEDSAHFKERMQKRKIIEHKNAELKRFHGMNRARYSGLLRMRIQAILTAFVVNAKRMVKLTGQNCSPPPMRWAAVLCYSLFSFEMGFCRDLATPGDIYCFLLFFYPGSL